VIAGGDGSDTGVAWRLADGTPLAHPLNLPEPSSGVALRGNIIVTTAGRDIGIDQQGLNDPYEIASCSALLARPTRPPDNGRLSGTSAAAASTAMLLTRNGYT
jgi:hypothetical protein